MSVHIIIYVLYYLCTIYLSFAAFQDNKGMFILSDHPMVTTSCIYVRSTEKYTAPPPPPLSLSLSM